MPVMLYFFVVVGIGFLVFFSGFVSGQGTTPGIEVIFKGRCEDFLQFRLEADAPSSFRNLECDKVWEAFRNAFAHKSPCQVETADYAAFYNMTGMEVAPSKVMRHLEYLPGKVMQTCCMYMSSD